MQNEVVIDGGICELKPIAKQCHAGISYQVGAAGGKIFAYAHEELMFCLVGPSLDEACRKAEKAIDSYNNLVYEDDEKLHETFNDFYRQWAEHKEIMNEISRGEMDDKITSLSLRYQGEPNKMGASFDYAATETYWIFCADHDDPVQSSDTLEGAAIIVEDILNKHPDFIEDDVFVVKGVICPFVSRNRVKWVG